MVDPKLPLFYKNTGRPMEILEAVPLMQYRVRYSNGGEETLTGLELEQKATNEKPGYQFTFEPDRRLRVSGMKGWVRFIFPSPQRYSGHMAYDMDLDSARKLSEELAQWVQDRDNE
jgi:hypothetical protein